MNIINYIKLRNTPVMIHNGSIGVSLSGGADSAILAYILMKHVATPIHFYTIATEEKNKRTISYSSNVINKCIELTKKTNVYHHIKYEQYWNNQTYTNYLNSQIRLGIIDVVYSAITTIPPDEELAKFKNQLKSDMYDTRKYGVTKPIVSRDGKWYFPFVNLNKKHIKDMYDEMSVLDTIFPLTMSCETFDFKHTHCENCWWCEERAWAFGQ